MHFGYKSDNDFLAKKGGNVFGEDDSIAQLDASPCYSLLVAQRNRQSQKQRPRNWRSAYYRIIDRWRDFICEYFLDHHNFVPHVDAFAHFLNKCFKCFCKNAWAVKWVCVLWINTLKHVFDDVIKTIEKN